MRTKRNQENSQHWKQKSCANCSRLNLIIFLKQKRKSRKERRNDGILTSMGQEVKKNGDSAPS